MIELGYNRGVGDATTPPSLLLELSPLVFANGDLFVLVVMGYAGPDGLDGALPFDISTVDATDELSNVFGSGYFLEVPSGGPTYMGMYAMALGEYISDDIPPGCSVSIVPDDAIATGDGVWGWAYFRFRPTDGFAYPGGDFGFSGAVGSGHSPGTLLGSTCPTFYPNTTIVSINWALQTNPLTVIDLNGWDSYDSAAEQLAIHTVYQAVTSPSTPPAASWTIEDDGQPSGGFSIGVFDYVEPTNFVGQAVIT